MKRIIILIMLSTMLSGCFERAIRLSWQGEERERIEKAVMDLWSVEETHPFVSREQVLNIINGGEKPQGE